MPVRESVYRTACGVSGFAGLISTNTFNLNATQKGCLIAILLTICLPLGFCSAYKYRAARSVLPPELEIAEVISYGESGVIMEGCAYGVYRLTPKGISNISKAGLVGRTPLKIIDGYKLLDGTTLHALSAPGCEASPSGPPFRETLDKPGGYYKILNHGEGLILADPKAGLVWFLYDG